MSIEVITMWYNESFLAPYFLRHYGFADLITIFLDRATTDDTLIRINKYKKCPVRIIPFEFPDGLDELIKIGYFNEAYRKSKADYVIIADADEFVFVRELKRKYYFCNLYQVTAFEKLDIDKPITQANYGYLDRQFRKPSVVRTGLSFHWDVGHHEAYLKGLKIIDAPTLYGAHWNWITLDFALNRLLNNRAPRQSQENIDCGFDHHYNNLTKEKITEEYYLRKSKCKKLW